MDATSIDRAAHKIPWTASLEPKLEWKKLQSSSNLFIGVRAIGISVLQVAMMQHKVAVKVLKLEDR